jgi:cytochrome c556
MSRSLILVIVTVCASGSAAQERPYDVVMKDVGAALGALRKSADAPDFARSAEQARRLEQLFEEAENFWTKFKTKDAIDAAAGARKVSASIAAAAVAKDAQKMKTELGGLGKFCTSCHDSHREQMPDKSYRIRP